MKTPSRANVAARFATPPKPKKPPAPLDGKGVCPECGHLVAFRKSDGRLRAHRTPQSGVICIGSEAIV